jgi:hypothetical protein
MEKGRYHFKDVGIDGRIMFKWILGKQGWRMWIGFISGLGLVVDSCKHGNGPLSSIKGGEFLDYV